MGDCDKHFLNHKGKQDLDNNENIPIRIKVETSYLIDYVTDDIDNKNYESFFSTGH